MKHLERRLLAIHSATIARGEKTLSHLWVQHVGYEDLRPYGASENEHARYTAIIDRINAHADDLVRQHGTGILRAHQARNDAYRSLSVEDLEFVEHMIGTYRPERDDREAA